ncbi:hypothetical protein PPACK8108_LOCUS20278 [Phakopsora pachyrhizi]|uniref:Uncharacterized protein n=1 Tax=Phakopsora pachyrhizi TaxID=170000 RepID=A0AAV0BEP0_PHAPC|nr:hypothetical protein PPACK8108_LOCUS20278 [Phakopsora pachyrhizi]
MLTVETIINNYEKQNQLKPQNNNQDNNPSKKSNSSSSSSLLTSSNSTSPGIFKSQLASSNPRYGRNLREQSINQLEPIIKTSTVSSPTSTSSATATPHETSFVSNQTTSTPTLKDSSRTTTKSSTSASNLSKDDDQSNPCKSFKVTLEDPCYKVLPAALKKYKIKEHDKNYMSELDCELKLLLEEKEKESLKRKEDRDLLLAVVGSSHSLAEISKIAKILKVD